MFWSVVKVAGSDRHLEHVACVAVERRPRSVPSPIGRDGDRAVVAVEGCSLPAASGVPPTEMLPVPGPRLTVPLVAVIEADPAKLGDDGRAAAGQAWPRGGDRVRPGGKSLAVEREAAGGDRERQRAGDGRRVDLPVAADAQADCRTGRRTRDCPGR